MVTPKYIKPYVEHGEKANAVRKITVSIPLHVLRTLSDLRTERQVKNLRHATNSDLLVEAFLHAFTGQPLPTDEELRRTMATAKKSAAKKPAAKKAAKKTTAKKTAAKKPAVKKAAAKKAVRSQEAGGCEEDHGQEGRQEAGEEGCRQEARRRQGGEGRQDQQDQQDLQEVSTTTTRVIDLPPRGAQRGEVDSETSSRPCRDVSFAEPETGAAVRLPRQPPVVKDLSLPCRGAGRRGRKSMRFARALQCGYLSHIRAAMQSGDSSLLDRQGEKARVSVDTR